MMTSEVKRPIMRYHGGKWILAPWIIDHFPEHRFYTEAFGGAGSVLLRKPRCYSEVINDLDGEIVNVFQVVRDQGNELIEKLRLTPFARTEFKQSYKKSDDPIEQARRTVVRSLFGFGSLAASGKDTGFRSFSNRSGTTPAHDFANYPDVLKFAINRLKGVVIENRDAKEIIKQHDSCQTLHYVDPPYVHETRFSRAKTDGYNFELSNEQHCELLDFLDTVQGMVVISGYRCDLYDQKLNDWVRIDRNAYADGAKPRVESLWLNKSAAEKQRQKDMWIDYGT